MKILVTGGAGFIGSHIVDRYIQEGHKVIVIDNLSTGRREFINPSSEFYEMDIRDTGIEDIIKEERPDIINHHAAQIDVRRSTEDPVEDASINILGSLRLIYSGIKYKIKKFIFASTGGAIYGEPDELPVNESYPPRPLSPYGIAKFAVENYLYGVSSYTGLDYTILRYGNVYGPRQNPLGEAGVCAIFIANLLNGRKCKLYGFGKPVRDYVYISDVVDANLIALKEGSRGVYNIATGVGTSVEEIYNMIRSILSPDNNPPAERLPLRAGELGKIYLDYSKAKTELGWEPKIDIKKGLQMTVEYYRSQGK